MVCLLFIIFTFERVCVFLFFVVFFFFKQKTAYEMRISDWSSDVCSSDLEGSFIKPDGGILILKKEDDPSFQRIVLAVEMKRQGTNDQRALEGKGKQSQGNAIERLGKNLIGF